jgi:hippurate hydrolase
MSTLLSAMHARADAFTALRRDIHQHPEIGFKEFRTSDLVAERLQRWGYEVTRGLGGTGVVGQLKRGSGTRKLGLRADMDALPIVESHGAALRQHPCRLDACLRPRRAHRDSAGRRRVSGNVRGI